jgi:hypothetical protein
MMAVSEEYAQALVDIDSYQQMLDEIIVALGSLGLSPSEIVGEIERLEAKVAKLEAALEEIGTSPFTDEHARIIARAALKEDSDE